MAKALTFKTDTGLLIYMVKEEDEFVVSIVGDRQKELLRTPVRAAAKKVFDALVKTYQEREKAEAAA